MSHLIVILKQLYTTKNLYWVKNHVTTLMRAAHWMTYSDRSKLKFSLSYSTETFESLLPVADLDQVFWGAVKYGRQ